MSGNCFDPKDQFDQDLERKADEQIDTDTSKGTETFMSRYKDPIHVEFCPRCGQAMKKSKDVYLYVCPGHGGIMLENNLSKERDVE